MRTNTETQPRIINGVTYGEIFFDSKLRPMIQVLDDDGDRYVTYAIPAELR